MLCPDCANVAGMPGANHAGSEAAAAPRELDATFESLDKLYYVVVVACVVYYWIVIALFFMGGDSKQDWPNSDASPGSFVLLSSTLLSQVSSCVLLLTTPAGVYLLLQLYTKTHG